MMSAAAHGKIEELSAQSARESSDMHKRLQDSQAKQADLSSMLRAKEQAHSDAAASLKQTQQEHLQAAQSLKTKVLQKCFSCSRQRLAFAGPANL